MYNLTESIVIGASLLEPYMPGTAEKIAAQLNTSLRSFEECTTFGGYISGSKVTEKPEILFARLDVKEVLERQQRCLRRVRHWRKRLRKKKKRT